MFTPLGMIKDMLYAYKYILKNRKYGMWYTDYIRDLRKRFELHKANKVTSLRDRRLFRLIYYEACIDSEYTFVREKYVRSGLGRKYIKNIIKHFLSSTG